MKIENFTWNYIPTDIQDAYSKMQYPTYTGSYLLPLRNDDQEITEKHIANGQFMARPYPFRGPYENQTVYTCPNDPNYWVTPDLGSERMFWAYEDARTNGNYSANKQFANSGYTRKEPFLSEDNYFCKNMGSKDSSYSEGFHSRGRSHHSIYEKPGIYTETLPQLGLCIPSPTDPDTCQTLITPIVGQNDYLTPYGYGFSIL